MVKVKAATLLILVALLLCSIVTTAIRHEPALSNDSSANTQQLKEGRVEEAEYETESCEGLGEEECLMRRATLTAHTDYIYTQEHKP